MDKERIVQKLNELLPALREKYRVSRVGLFGSYARGEARSGSDADILVEFSEPIGLLKFLELESYLSDALGIRVDLVSKKALKPTIGKRILKEVINI